MLRCEIHELLCPPRIVIYVTSDKEHPSCNGNDLLGDNVKTLLVGYDGPRGKLVNNFSCTTANDMSRHVYFTLCIDTLFMNYELHAPSIDSMLFLITALLNGMPLDGEGNSIKYEFSRDDTSVLPKHPHWPIYCKNSMNYIHTYNEDKMSSKFFILWNPADTQPPRRKYQSYEVAQADAIKMVSDGIAKEMHILESTALVKPKANYEVVKLT